MATDRGSVHLTLLEAALFDLVLTRPGIDTNELARKIWGALDVYADKLVNAYRWRVNRKIRPKGYEIANMMGHKAGGAGNFAKYHVIKYGEAA